MCIRDRYYDAYIQDFASNPDESVNYVTSHDNLTLWDKLEISCPHYSEEDQIKIAMLAQAIVLTSQGIPFIFGGEELLRTKMGNHNSYNAGDFINRIDSVSYTHLASKRKNGKDSKCDDMAILYLKCPCLLFL